MQYRFKNAKIKNFRFYHYLCGISNTMIMIQENHIDAALKELFDKLTFTQEPAGLYDPLRYMIEIGGKRIRPRLCLTAYALYKDAFDEAILTPAAAIEVFHSFTLIHDDIMDKADVRRGVPTVYRKWDENTAILSGDVMSIESYKMIAKAPAKVLPQVLDLFNKTAAEVCEGQQFDMDFENEDYVPMSDYLKMIGLKTAVLIACSAKIGALIGGASEEEAQALYDFGYQLGIAFQITDDYLDVYADPNVFGKNIGGDITNNKKSWLLVKTMKDAQGEDKEELNSILALSEEQAEEKIARMKALYNKLDIAAAAEKEIDKYYSSALASLAKVEMDDDKRSMMEEFAHQIVKRQK